MDKFANYGTEAMRLNSLFIQALNDPSMEKEAADNAAEFLKLQIYEDSFHERILPAQTISVSMCDRDVNSPNMQVVIDKEFIDATAVTSTLRGGGGNYDYVETERYAVKFNLIESPEYAITEQELRSKRQPIQDLIKHHVAFYIKKQMDTNFIGMSNASIAASGLLYDLSSGTEQIITPTNLTTLRRQIDNQSTNGRYLRAATLLMTQSQFNYVSTWNQTINASGSVATPGVTSGLTEQFWKDGYRYDTLLGLRVVKTVKSDLLGENEVLLYTEPEYLGHHFTFNDDRFSIERKHYTYKWKGYRTYGAAFGNTNAVAKMKLKPIA